MNQLSWHWSGAIAFERAESQSSWCILRSSTVSRNFTPGALYNGPSCYQIWKVKWKCFFFHLPRRAFNKYSETCINHIKRTTSIKWRQWTVPKFSSHIYCKINLHSAHTSVKRTRTPILSHFVAKNLQQATLQELFTSKGLAETPLTLFSDVALKLSDYSRLMHWLTGNSPMSSVWSYTVLNCVTKELIINYYCTTY